MDGIYASNICIFPPYAHRQETYATKYCKSGLED